MYSVLKTMDFDTNDQGNTLTASTVSKNDEFFSQNKGNLY